MEKVIQVSHLAKSYGGRTAVRDLSLSVCRGTVFGLLGANGAGKTTAIECMLGIRKSDHGKTVILGMNPDKQRKALFTRVGVQFQDSSYQREIKVREICEEIASLYRYPADWRELLDRFGIEGRENEMVKALSGGQRQRLFIILALIPRPEVVFLDELTTGLDVKARREVWKILRTLKENGLTILLTSHFMDEVEVLCDQICILRAGEIAYQGTVEQALADSGCEKFEDAYLQYAGEEAEEA